MSISSALKLTKAQVSAAEKTLVLVAVGAGGTGELGKSVFAHGVNLSGIEQGSLVAGAALLASAAHVATAYGTKALASFKAKSATKAAAVTEAELFAADLKAVVAEYRARHAAPKASASEPVAVVDASPVSESVPASAVLPDVPPAS